MHPEWIDLEYI